MHGGCRTHQPGGVVQFVHAWSIAQCQALVQEFGTDPRHSWSHPPAKAHSKTRTDTIAHLAMVEGLADDLESAAASSCALAALFTELQDDRS